MKKLKNLFQEIQLRIEKWLLQRRLKKIMKEGGKTRHTLSEGMND
jgi:hypothetical protein